MAHLKSSHRLSIDQYFKQNHFSAFNLAGLSDFIAEQRAQWGLRKSWSVKHISQILIDGGWIKEISLTSDLYRPKTRFASRLASRYQIALSVRGGSYLSHGTAASLHSLIDIDTAITYCQLNRSMQHPPESADFIGAFGWHRRHPKKVNAGEGVL